MELNSKRDDGRTQNYLRKIITLIALGHCHRKQNKIVEREQTI